MKLSVSLPEDDVSFVDEYSAKEGLPSRSSVIHRAIGLLRAANLQEAYAEAFDEWDGTEDAALWDTTSADTTSADTTSPDTTSADTSADGARAAR